jgi:hypothetical protein
MQAFLNDQKIKEAAIARLGANPVSSDGINFSHYEIELGIPKEVGMWEDVIFEELAPTDATSFPLEFLQSIKPGADLSVIPAHLVLWQFEDSTYGLKNIVAVRKDSDLLHFCEEFVALYRREIEGTPISTEELQNLNARVSAAWDVLGEKQRVASMMRARRWAWIGGRKWAWIPTKGWSGAWKWLLAWESRAARMRALKREMLSALTKAI